MRKQLLNLQNPQYQSWAIGYHLKKVCLFSFSFAYEVNCHFIFAEAESSFFASCCLFLFAQVCFLAGNIHLIWLLLSVCLCTLLLCSIFFIILGKQCSFSVLPRSHTCGLPKNFILSIPLSTWQLNDSTSQFLTQRPVTWHSCNPQCNMLCTKMLSKMAASFPLPTNALL